MATKQIFQLKITLKGIEPNIWRKIQVPSTYNFWELHSAIQDAFGWTNSHLHKFTYTDDSTDKPIEIGIPLEPEFKDDVLPLPGWEYKIKPFITGNSSQIVYTYDFGDNWEHTVELYGIMDAVAGIKYPKCIAGERNCPPEDCGGVHGYANLLEILFDPDDEDYEDTKEWVDSVNGGVFHPEEFDPAAVKFMSPARRFKKCFE